MFEILVVRVARPEGLLLSIHGNCQVTGGSFETWKNGKAWGCVERCMVVLSGIFFSLLGGQVACQEA